jgi:hypothetical protein
MATNIQYPRKDFERYTRELRKVACSPTKDPPLEIGFECWILDIESSLDGNTFSDRANGIQNEEQIAE